MVALSCRGLVVVGLLALASGGGARATAIPSAPSGVTLEWVGGVGGGVRVQWTDNSADETGFRVLRTTFDFVSAVVPLTDLPAGTTEYIDQTAEGGAEPYSYTVVALGGSGDSDPSTAAQMYTPNTLDYTSFRVAQRTKGASGKLLIRGWVVPNGNARLANPEALLDVTDGMRLYFDQARAYSVEFPANSWETRVGGLAASAEVLGEGVYGKAMFTYKASRFENKFKVLLKFGLAPPQFGAVILRVGKEGTFNDEF